MSGSNGIERIGPTGWRDVRDLVRRRLHDRTWRPGDRIPDEAALAEQLGCSRSTVSRALRALADDGLLERKRKGGTRVSERGERRARLAVTVTRHEVEALGATHGHALLVHERVAGPPAVRKRFGASTRRRLWHLKTLHTADERPFALEDRWIDPQAVPELADADLERTSVNEWLVEHVPLSRGTIGFSAEGADAHATKALGIAHGTAVFVVERTTWSESGAITWVRIVYAPGYRVETTL